MKVMWLNNVWRIGPWPMPVWSVWAWAFDVGPVRILRRKPTEGAQDADD